MMTDTANDDSDGTMLFAAWASNHMRWTDVAVTKDETTYALTRKDSDEARGKRLCASGSIIQIEVHKLKDQGIGKLATGLLMSYGGNIFEFMAAGSTGDLVQNSQARLCGVVTGTYDYTNSAGGTGHAVTVVGMFDLPENKSKQPTPTTNGTGGPPSPKAQASAKIAACCAAVRNRARQLGNGPEAFQLSGLAAQCDVFAQQGDTAGFTAISRSVLQVQGLPECQF
jgi:hypothetical protein